MFKIDLKKTGLLFSCLFSLRSLRAIFFASFLFLLISSSDKVSAQEQPVGFSVSPPVFEFTANPGDILQNVVKVENLTGEDITVELDKKDFVAIGDEGQVELIDDSGDYSLSSWIQFSEDSRTIASKKQALIPFKIIVPENASPGGHFVSLIIRSNNAGSIDSSGATLSQEIGSLVLLRVSGEAEESLKISSFSTDKSFYEYAPIDFEIVMQNDGNVHLKPIGKITINNIFGQKVDEIEVTSKNVLPEASRKLDAKWDPGFLFGKYTATTSLVYGLDDEIVTSTTTFLVIPIKLTLTVLFVLVFTLGLLYVARKRIALAMKILFGKSTTR